MAAAEVMSGFDLILVVMTLAPKEQNLLKQSSIMLNYSMATHVAGVVLQYQS